MVDGSDRLREGAEVRVVADGPAPKAAGGKGGDGAQPGRCGRPLPEGAPR